MKGTQGIIYIIEVPSTVMFWIGRHIRHQDHPLAIGVNPNVEVMMKIIHWIGNLDVFSVLIMIHIIRLMLSEIGRLIHIQNLISFGMAMPAMKTMVIEDMINLAGLGDMIMMTMHMMMIMAIGLVYPIIIGRIAMRGILIMVDTVMILIMEEVEEIVIGSDADLGTENMIKDIQVGKEI